MNVIEIEHLFFSFGNLTILEDVSFNISEGEFIGVFGPNGGGKTTLLNLMMGFLKPARGKISILGLSPKAARTQIGWVPQSFHYDRAFPISVKDVVLEGRLSKLPWHGFFKKDDFFAIEEALDQVGMRGWINAPFSTLSGGQAQRVLMARALVCEPTLLLLDEPTASIDKAVELELYDLLCSLKRKITIVMVTHDLEPAVKNMDRFFCIQKKLTPMEADRVCEHFAIGLYHPPIKKRGDKNG